MLNCRHSVVLQMPAPRGLSYRDVLLTNVMDTEGAEWPEAPFRPSLGMRLEVLKKVSSSVWGPLKLLPDGGSLLIPFVRVIEGCVEWLAS